jgi:formate hydrogenlyase subunit 6/NADH:ubiquinone oxidoreductase subunit I
MLLGCGLNEYICMRECIEEIEIKDEREEKKKKKFGILYS